MEKGQTSGEELILTGIPVSQGVAEGRIFVIPRQAPLKIPRFPISEKELSSQIRRLEEAILKTRDQIHKLQQRLTQSLGGTQEARLFDAHLLILDDPTLFEETVQYMKEHRVNVEHALATVAEKFVQAFSEMEDEYMRERAADVRDVTNRVLYNLIHREAGHPPALQDLQEPAIVVAYDLAPSEAATLDRTQVLGLATDQGSTASHVAILARALGIPAVTGLKDATCRLNGGELALLDGYSGQLIINPTPRTRYEYITVQRKWHALEDRFEQLKDLPAVTPDGHRIILSANIESPKEVDLVLQYGAEGVGLFRTEYLFLGRHSLPDEEEQYQAYAEVARRLYPQPVIIRTLDIGGDKMIAFRDIPPERNPFLGWRAIRICLQEREIFRNQVRAILRAGSVGNVKMMYPMVSDLTELTQANNFVQECKAELKAEGIPFRADIEIGVMIEIPSAALQAEGLAQHSSFFSIGTNDLIQYTLAVDRTNPRIAHLYKPTHPAVIRLMHGAIQAAHRNGIWVGVCGEAAGDPVLVPLLLGLGADELSVSPRLVPQVKYVIRNCPMSEAKALAEFALRCEDSGEILERAQLLLQSIAPELEIYTS